MAGHDFGTSGGPGAAPTPPPGSPRQQRRGGIGFGVVLIAVGIVFLIAQFIPGVAWWQMWPLIVILVGGIQIVTPDPRDGWGASRIMDGVGTLIVGFVLLGNTTGFISWNVWWTLLTLWPILLVAIGLRIIGRAVEQTWLRALAPVVIWAAFAYAVAVSLTGAGGLRPIPQPFQTIGKSFDLSEPLGDVSRANLVFEGGAGDIMFADTNQALISAKGKSPFGTPSLAVKRAGSDAEVRLGLGNQDGVAVWPGLTAGGIDVGLSDKVLWDVVLQTGASSVSADFSHVKLDGLTVRTGASSVDVKLGEVPDSVTKDDVVVKAGASSVDIEVPKDAAVRVVTQSGLSSTDVSGDFSRQGDGSWETPGFGSASHTYQINIESGVGSVSVKQS